MIRAARVADIPGIAQVHVASWRTTYAGQIPQSVLDGLSVPEREKRWTSVFHDTGHKIAVAERDEAIVGFSNFGPSRDGDRCAETGELYALYLLQKASGQGFGRQLWDYTLESLKADGYSVVTLWVLEGNAKARGFYESMGLKVDGNSKEASFDGAVKRELRYRFTSETP